MERKTARLLWNGQVAISNDEWKNIPDEIVPTVCLTGGASVTIKHVV